MNLFFSLFILSLSIACTFSAYSDSIARNVLLPVSAAAYYNNASADTCVTNIFKNAKLIRKYKTGFLLDTHTAMTVLDKDDRAIIVAFG